MENPWVRVGEFVWGIRAVMIMTVASLMFGKKRNLISKKLSFVFEIRYVTLVFKYHHNLFKCPEWPWLILWKYQMI